MPNYSPLTARQRVFLVMLLLQAQCSFNAKAAVDYNGNPLGTARGSIVITPNTSPATLNSYFQASNSAGLPNNSFGSLGTITTNISPQTPITSATVYSILLQPDGKIITVSSNTLIRYNTNGSLDSSFGTGGIATIAANIVHPNGAVLLNTGQILVVDNVTINVYSST